MRLKIRLEGILKIVDIEFSISPKAQGVALITRKKPVP